MSISLFQSGQKIHHYALSSLILSLVFFNAAFSLEYIYAAARVSPNTLYVSKVGYGIITSIPEGISCGKQCRAGYESGALVTLTATPAQGYVFAGWQYDCRPPKTPIENTLVPVEPSPVCNVKIDRQRKIAVAVFKKTTTSTPSASTVRSTSGVSETETGTTTTDSRTRVCPAVAIKCAVGYHSYQTPGSCNLSCVPDTIAPVPVRDPTYTGSTTPPPAYTGTTRNPEKIICPSIQTIMCAEGYHNYTAPGTCSSICVPDKVASDTTIPKNDKSTNSQKCQPVSIDCLTGYQPSQVPGSCNMVCVPTTRNPAGTGVALPPLPVDPVPTCPGGTSRTTNGLVYCPDTREVR